MPNQTDQIYRSLRIKEAEKRYGLSRSMIYRLMAAKKVVSVKVGGRRLLLVESLEALIASPS